MIYFESTILSIMSSNDKKFMVLFYKFEPSIIEFIWQYMLVTFVRIGLKILSSS